MTDKAASMIGWCILVAGFFIGLGINGIDVDVIIKSPEVMIEAERD